MERRHFLKLAFGFTAGAAVLAASAHAAPLAPHPLPADGRLPPSNEDARPADISEDEAKRLKPEEVRWGHGHGHGHHGGWHRGRHHGWHRRHHGWHHRRHWRRRHW